ncbi:glycosyltransferase family 9 protein [Candidatus Omnitrophota bacterium]
MQNKHTSFIIINTYGIGDVLFSTPLIRSIKESFPESRIYYLCNRRTENILKNNPFIDKTFVYERDEFENIKKKSRIQYFAMWFKFICEMRKERIQVIFDLSMNSLFGFIGFLIGARQRIGFNYKRRGFFLTKKIPLIGFENKHVAEHHLDVIRTFGIPAVSTKMEVYSSKESSKWAHTFFKKHNLTVGDRIIGIAPCGGQAFGKSAFVKRWPEIHFSVLINQLIKSYDAKILLFAGPNEKDSIQTILTGVEKQENCFEFTDSSLDQIIALVKRCELFIGNDTGPLRFANAYNKKIIAFFGPVDEKVYGMHPFDATKHIYMTMDIACRPCYQRFRLAECNNNLKCLTDISVDEVMCAVNKLLS